MEERFRPARTFFSYADHDAGTARSPAIQVACLAQLQCEDVQKGGLMPPPCSVEVSQYPSLEISRHLLLTSLFVAPDPPVNKSASSAWRPRSLSCASSRRLQSMIPHPQLLYIALQSELSRTAACSMMLQPRKTTCRKSTAANHYEGSE